MSFNASIASAYSAASCLELASCCAYNAILVNPRSVSCPFSSVSPTLPIKSDMVLIVLLMESIWLLKSVKPLNSNSTIAFIYSLTADAADIMLFLYFCNSSLYLYHSLLPFSRLILDISFARRL